MDKELNKTEFFNRLYKGNNDSLLDQYYFQTGQYGNEDFVIFESWDSVIAVNAYINGYRGNLSMIELYHKDDLIAELNKAEAQLEKELEVNPTHYGTHSRLNSHIEKLMNLSAYKRWLLNNEIEEKSIDDYGVNWGFSDEYEICSQCQQEVVRTSPDSYSWTAPLYVEGEGYVCDECAKSCTEYVLEEYCNVEKGVPDQFDMADLGLVKVNADSFENGWYGGQCDTPKPIIAALNAQDVDCYFKVEPSQFDLSFDVYVKEADLDKAIAILDSTNTKLDEDPAEVLKRGLQAATIASANCKGDGITYTTINTNDGTAIARKVSNEEFIEGIKK